MDFNSLTRRELQALCKKNKIPANITNIAMSSALKALDTVEGMEEFYNPPSVVSPKKTAMASPYVPCTGGRTSTRKKTIKEKSDSVQITTRSRRRTKTVADEVEDAKIDVVETKGKKSIRKPVASGIQEMETPRNYKDEISVRKINTLRSTILLEKKTKELNFNHKEGIQPIDFGRSDREVPNDDMKGNVKEDSDDFGLNQETISVDVLLKIDEKALSDEVPARELEQVSEVLDESDLDLVSEEHPLMLTPKMVTDNDDGTYDANKGSTDQNAAADDGNNDRAQTRLGEESEEYGQSDILLGENLEKSQDLKYEGSKEEDRTDQNGVDDDNNDDTKLGEGSQEYGESDILTGENLEKSQNLPKEEDCTDQNAVVAAADDNDDRAQIKLGDGSEEYGESDIVSGENLEKSQDLPKQEDCTDQNAVVAADDDNDDRTQTKLGEGSEEYVRSDIFPGENLEKSQDLKYEVPKQEGCDDSGCIDNTTKHLMSENHEEEFNAGKNEGSKDSDDIMNHVVDDLVSEADSEKTEFGILSLSVSGSYQKQDTTELQNQTINKSEMKSVTDLDSTLTDENVFKVDVVLADDGEIEFDHHVHSICCNQFGKEKEITLVTPNCVVESSELDIESSYEVLPTAVSSNDEVNCSPLTNNQICTTDSDDIMDRVVDDLDYEDSEKIEIGILSLNVSGASEYQKQDTELQNQTINESEMKSVNDLDSTMWLSPCCLGKSGADPLQGQMMSSLLQIGSDSDCLICPSLTPLKKSSNKIPTTISRKIDNFLDGNKENIENSGMKLDLIKEKGKKEDAPDSMNKKSLRQLKKMYKEMAQITKKSINEDKDFAQVGRARPALQTLSENRLAASEPFLVVFRQNSD